MDTEKTFKILTEKDKNVMKYTEREEHFKFIMRYIDEHPTLAKVKEASVKAWETVAPYLKKMSETVMGLVKKPQVEESAQIQKEINTEVNEYGLESMEEKNDDISKDKIIPYRDGMVMRIKAKVIGTEVEPETKVEVVDTEDHHGLANPEAFFEH